MFDAGFVSQDTFGDGFYQPVAIVGVEELAFLGCVGEEAAFDEDGGTGGVANDDEAGAAYAAIVGAGGAEEGFLDAVGEPGVLFVGAVAAVRLLVARGLPSAKCGGGRDGTGGGETEGFDAIGDAARVEMETDEEVGMFLRGEFRA